MTKYRDSFQWLDSNMNSRILLDRIAYWNIEITGYYWNYKNWILKYTKIREQTKIEKKTLTNEEQLISIIQVGSHPNLKGKSERMIISNSKLKTHKSKKIIDIHGNFS